MDYRHQLPCPPLSPGVCSNSRPLNRWCHPTISSSVAPFSSCPQSFPASGSFPMNWLFVSGSQSIGALASVLPMNIQGWFPLGLTRLIEAVSRSWPPPKEGRVAMASLLQERGQEASQDRGKGGPFKGPFKGVWGQRAPWTVSPGESNTGDVWYLCPVVRELDPTCDNEDQRQPSHPRHTATKTQRSQINK